MPQNKKTKATKATKPKTEKKPAPSADSPTKTYSGSLPQYSR